MATTVTYNNVVIHNCVTREFDQELLYDASGTDLIAVRYKLGFEGYVHAQQALTVRHGIQESGGPTNTGATHTQFALVSMRLAEPRQAFTLRWQGNLILAAEPATAAAATASMDVDNGPKPRGLAVLHVSPASIKVRWSVEFMLSGCPAGQAGDTARKGPFKIINNRWSISETLDADFFTTRRIAGTIRFAEGLTAKHAYKAAVVPGIEKGFRRELIEYDVGASGLEATYAIADRQVHYAAPWPATHMDVVHTYSTNDALTWLDDCSVTLRGSPEADRRMLLMRMMQIIDARSEGLRVANAEDKQYLLENAVITEHFGEANVVNCQITVRHMGEGTRTVLGNILENKLGKTLELPDVEGHAYDPSISRVPAVHGYDPQGQARSPAFLYLLTCYHQDPCSQVKHIFGGSQTAPHEEPGQDKETPPYPVQSPGLQLPAGNDSNYSNDQKQAAYTLASLSNRYVVDRMRVVLPKGQADSAGNTADVGDLVPGLAMRILYFDAERIGDWPQIPSVADTYTDGPIVGTLLRYVVEPQPPVLSPDGYKKIFRVRVKACYALNRLPTAEETVAVGVLPYTSFQPAATAFPISQSQNANIGP